MKVKDMMLLNIYKAELKEIKDIIVSDIDRRIDEILRLIVHVSSSNPDALVKKKKEIEELNSLKSLVQYNILDLDTNNSQFILLRNSQTAINLIKGIVQT
ncbi:hypothetical protein D3C72_966890 [compost metagenome]